MSECGHASGITYAGCMKCDLDKLKERIAELEAAMREAASKRYFNAALQVLAEALGDKI